MFYLLAIKLGICMILLIIAIVWHSYLTMKLFCTSHFEARSAINSALCNQCTVVYSQWHYITLHSIAIAATAFKWWKQCCFDSSATRWQMPYRPMLKPAMQSHPYKNQSVILNFIFVLLESYASYVYDLFWFLQPINFTTTYIREMWLHIMMYVCRSLNSMELDLHIAHILL